LKKQKFTNAIQRKCRYLVVLVSLKKQIVEFSNSDDLNLGKVTPRNEKNDRHQKTDKEAHVDVEEDGSEEGRHPDEGLRKRPFGVADEVLELKEDSDQRDHDDGG